MSWIYRFTFVWVFLLLGTSRAQEGFERLTFHQAPGALDEAAVISDWPRLLGATDDAHSAETPLLKRFGKSGPKTVWEVSMGEGYTSPSIVGNRVVLFHSLNGRETVECLHAETGQRFWAADYEVDYQDRYGFANGPRGSPVVADGVVVVLGVTSQLRGYDLVSGVELWSRDLRMEYHVPQDFFGHGTTPLIEDGRVIVNVGGKAETIPKAAGKRDRAAILATAGVSVAAFDLKTGSTIWEVEHPWGASYASPVMAKLHDCSKVLIFAGGESDPPIGGLMCIDPETGKLESTFPWRADDYISATASSPMVVPGSNRVLISTCYPKGRPLGAAMIEYDASFQPREVWTTTKLGTHWMTPVFHEGYIYAIDGERENNSRLVCVAAATGEERWSEEITWEDPALAEKMGRSGPVQLGILRASLIRVDGAFLCLGELGTLLWLDLAPDGCKVMERKQLFYAANTWSLPALSRGLLYVRQQDQDLEVSQQAGPRVVCYDLRAQP